MTCKVIVIGGGMGGIAVASELHKLMKDSVQVTIVDARDYVD